MLSGVLQGGRGNDDDDDDEGDVTLQPRVVIGKLNNYNLKKHRFKEYKLEKARDDHGRSARKHEEML